MATASPSRPSSARRPPGTAAPIMLSLHGLDSTESWRTSPQIYNTPLARFALAKDQKRAPRARHAESSTRQLREGGKHQSLTNCSQSTSNRNASITEKQR